MPPRHYPEPQSRLALWSFRIAILGALVAAMAAGATRLDWLDGLTGLYVTLGGVALGLVAVPVGLLAGVLIWRSGYGGARYAVFGVVLAMFLATPAMIVGVLAGRYPRINDITTDVIDPPAFDIVTSVRGRLANSTTYPGPEVAKLQQQFYPEIRSIDLDISAEDINEIISDWLEEQQLRVLDQVDYKGPGKEGRVEAVARSRLMGFRDDIVIRVRSVNGRVRVDARSASRYGNGDFGVNAKRINTLLDELRKAGRRVRR